MSVREQFEEWADSQGWPKDAARRQMFIAYEAGRESMQEQIDELVDCLEDVHVDIYNVDEFNNYHLDEGNLYWLFGKAYDKRTNDAEVLAADMKRILNIAMVHDFEGIEAIAKQALAKWEGHDTN